MLYIAFFLTVSLSLYTVFVYREERVTQMKRRLAKVKGAGQSETEGTAPASGAAGEGKQGGLVVRLLGPAWRGLRRLFRRRGRISLSRTMLGGRGERIERLLLQAGRPFGMSPVDYRMLQLALLVGLPAIALFYSLILGIGGGATVLVVLAATAAAFILPGWYLRLKARQRCRLALRELPDVLDLLTVSLEAGLGFDSALSKLISKKRGVLQAEFHRCLEEIRLGKTRREALTGVKERLELDEVKVLISSILQAEKLGIGMVQVLRVQSQEVREQRRQRAEEEAMKAPIKMLFPLVLFIFPSLFIVLLGPVVIQFIDAFGQTP